MEYQKILENFEKYGKKTDKNRYSIFIDDQEFFKEYNNIYTYDFFQTFKNGEEVEAHYEERNANSLDI